MDWLIELAFKTPPIRSARVAAAVCIRGDVVGVGQNALKTHPFQARWGRNQHSIYWHAETRALHESLNRVEKADLARAEIWVCRVDSRQRLKCSRPCRGCQQAIDYYKLKAIHYTDEHRGWVTLATQRGK